MALRLLAAAVVGAMALNPGVAKAQASPFLPLDHGAYAFIDALQSRGQLNTLSWLDRPYTVAAIRRALADTSSRPTAVEAGWRMKIAGDIALIDVAPDDPPTNDASGETIELGLGGSVVGTAQTSSRRELMLADERSNVTPGIEMHFFLRAGPVVGVSRILGDRRLKYDPEFPGKQDRPLTGRTEDAYMSAQARFGELTVGRLARNWGPQPLHGLQLSDNPFTFDHVHARVGPRRLNLSTILARLDSRPRGVGQLPDSRYFAAHRLGFVLGRLELGISEAVLYGGQGRGFEPAMANPLSAHVLGSFNEFRASNDGNLTYTVDVAWRTRRFGIWSAQLLIDDMQIDQCDVVCEEPASYGLSVGGEGLPLYAAHRLFWSYRQIANLTYRTSDPALAHTVYDVGLGDGYSDFDETRIGWDLAVTPHATARVYGAYRRQGEGDYRAAFPEPSQYPTTPRFLSGSIARISRLGIESSGYAGAMEFRLDVGINRLRVDAPSITGANREGFEGRIRVRYRPDWIFSRSWALDELN